MIILRGVLILSDNVTIFEMGPRDGLQNEKSFISTENKVRLVDLLSASGLTKIEVTSFVSPKWVPQLADAARVMSEIRRAKRVSYAVLTPNLRGFEDALPARPSEIAVFASASEGFSQKNINCTIEESLRRFEPVLLAARRQCLPVRGYVSCVTDCPYEGETKASSVARVTERLLDLGCYEVSLGDTLGTGTPDSVNSMLSAVLDVSDPTKLAGHFHDTQGNALSNIEVCLQRGLRVFDASVGGLGGCPYAPGAQGNVASEAVLERVNELGFQTGVDVDKLSRAAGFARSLRP